MKVLGRLPPAQSAVHPSCKYKTKVDQRPYEVHLTNADRPLSVIIFLTPVIECIELRKEEKSAACEKEWHRKVTQTEKGVHQTRRMRPFVGGMLHQNEQCHDKLHDIQRRIHFSVLHVLYYLVEKRFAGLEPFHILPDQYGQFFIDFPRNGRHSGKHQNV